MIFDQALTLERYVDSFSAYEKLSFQSRKHSNLQIMERPFINENYKKFINRKVKPKISSGCSKSENPIINAQNCRK